MTTVVRRAT